MIQLSDQVRTEYLEKGYVVVKNLIDQDLVESMKKASLDLMKGDPHSPRLLQYFDEDLLDRVENFVLNCEPFKSAFLSEAMLQVVSHCFGQSAVLFKDKLNYKVPGRGQFPPHQDAAADWARYGSEHITLGISLDTATKENGWLEMVSGWHTQGLLSPLKTPLSDALSTEMKWEGISMEPGDAILFSSFTPHRSEPNLTQQFRRLILVTYGALKDGFHTEQFFEEKRKRQKPKSEWRSELEYERDAFGKYYPKKKKVETYAETE